MAEGKLPESAHVKKIVYASLFAALTGAGAWISIPLLIVPITLQTLFVILAGGMLGAYYGALSMVVYILLGLVGLPVFSRGQSGVGVLIGPTGGYLVGFVVAAFIIGLLVSRVKRPGFAWNLMAMSIGTIAIYACGVAGLIIVTHMAPASAIVAGVLPFLPGDIAKVIVAAYISSKFSLEK